jgi:hypothetical protein
MRILLDECVPRRLRSHLVGHEVRTVAEMAWRGKRNGDLLRAMVGQGFDVLLTVDRNLPYQQNLRAGGIALVVLASGGITLADLIPLMRSTLAALVTVKPGEMVEITA